MKMAATITHLTASNGNDPKGKHLANSEEPLGRFREAKKMMSDFYTDLITYITELSKFYSDLEEGSPKLIPPAEKNEVERFKDSIRGIRDMVGRDSMKVVFFGRTSNGKSSVINSMLGSRVLPQGMGHTTSCFLQVEGSENEKYFLMEGEEKKRPLDELDTVGHALVSGDSSMGNDSLIRISYPKSASKLLKNDVVIVDSPGVDLSPLFDNWIDKHCLDADVFVLVCNAESTLTQAEKNFFLRVSKKLSRPNVFILCNRWDASASETEQNRSQIRAQHEQRLVDFLVKELEVCTTQEAKNRFFFISAREMLDSRLREKGELRITPYQQEGFQRRAMEFKLFEEQFEKCISKSAIRTKFEAHGRKAREFIGHIEKNLETVYNTAFRERRKMDLDYKIKNKEFATSRENFGKYQRIYYDQLQKVRSEIHMKVTADFYDEITRLEAIIDKFNALPFSDDDPDNLECYKEKLADYVNIVLGEELQNQCTGALTERIWKIQKQMLNGVQEIVDGEHIRELDKIWLLKQPFKFTIVLNCPQLMADFHEDLEFRFSLGIENIARWILSITRGQPITAIDRNILGINLSPQSHRAAQAHLQPDKGEVDAFLANLFVHSAGYLVNGSVGLTIVGLVVYKNVDWRWIAAGVSSIAGLYMFERLRWDTSAKEERLKTQFRQHLEQRLQQTGSIHGSHCEQQVVQEMEQMYGLTRTVVADNHMQMKERIDQTMTQMKTLEKLVATISSFRNKINFMNVALDSFSNTFLNTESP